MRRMRILRSKKGQGLSLNTIVIAAIVMIVLIVLIMIFTGRLSIFSQLFGKVDESCGARGGKWCDIGVVEECAAVNGVKETLPNKICCPISYFGKCSGTQSVG